ncbi:serine/threonine-protein kinase [Nocardiopsis algeriensis]|uniref:Protein kinase domain-containing protein n=1 Tax=Nocardiopsis algeriensis TaxID=1478215 RepID=A0A841IPR0_9ACTN|nr:serine/threonine-protein kinase [Nocardiopsis algeriensis]MBB6120170.1 hypothetical protein [Nocardiopsis algeriensis]
MNAGTGGRTVLVELPASAMDLSPEEPYRIGPYHLVKRLGAGGMGVVYAGIDRRGRPVAVKTVHVQYAADPAFRARFAREVELMRRVRGTCVVPLIDADPSAEQPWLAAPLVDGPTLSAQVRGHGPLDPRLLLGLGMGAAEALAQIHRHGIAHRDLKPANVILSATGPKVLDFGIARAVDETALTGTGVVTGSSGWISPQQYRGEPATFADDVFSWGCTLAYAATGRPPFGTGMADVVAFRVLQTDPDLEGLEGPLAPLVRAALDKDAGERPSAEQLLEQIAQVKRDRYAAEGDASAVLTGVLDREWFQVEGTATQTHSVALHAAGRRGHRRRAGRGRALAVGAGAAALLLGAVLVARWPENSGEEAAEAGPVQAEAGEARTATGEVEETVTQALLGHRHEPDGARPGGHLLVGLQPFDLDGEPHYMIDVMTGEPNVDLDEREPLWGRLAEDAEVLCAWSFCTEAAGALDSSAYGTTPVEPGVLTGFLDATRGEVVAEVTYTVNVDGIARITRVVEFFQP